MQDADIGVVLASIRQAQALLGDYIEPAPRNAEKTVEELLAVLDRTALVEAMDRLEATSPSERL